jgi:Na+/melibiose symporter-like transporter
MCAVFDERNVVAITAKRSLLRDKTFRSYFVGQTISLFCAAMTPVIMPLIAVLSLHATALGASVVSTSSLLPGVLFMLPAGAFLDQLPKREAMLWANVGVAVSLCLAPVLWWLGALSVPVLCLIGFISTSCGIVSQIADQSLIPYLVEDSRIVEANSKIALSESTASMAGPTAAGFAVTVIGGPVSFGLAALGSLFSAFTLSRIQSNEPPADKDIERPNLRRQILEGLGFIWRHPVLRTLMLVNGVDNGFVAWIEAIITVFFVRNLGWSATSVGLVMGIAAVGGIVGSMCVERLHSRLGTEHLLLTAVVLGGPAEAVVLLLHPGLVGKVIAVVGQFAVIFFSVCYSVTSRTLRQTGSPDRLRARITAGHRWVSLAVTPLGALAGGVVSTQVGVRGSIAIGCIGLLGAPTVALASPLRHSGAIDALRADQVGSS